MPVELLLKFVFGVAAGLGLALFAFVLLRLLGLLWRFAAERAQVEPVLEVWPQEPKQDNGAAS